MSRQRKTQRRRTRPGRRTQRRPVYQRAMAGLVARLEAHGWHPGWPLARRVLLALFVVALPLVVDLDNTTYHVTKTTAAMIGIGAMLVVWAAETFHRHRQGAAVRLHHARLGLPLVGVLAAMGLSLVNAESLRLSLQSVGVFAYLTLLAFFVADTVRGRADVMLVVASALAAALPASVYGLLQYYQLVPGHPEPRVPGELMISTLGNKNYLGGYLGYWLWPGLAALVVARTQAFKGFVLLCLGAMFAALVAIRSDGVWIAVALALPVGLGVAWRLGVLGPLRANRGWLLALAALGIVALAFISAPAPWNSWPSLAQDPASEGAPPKPLVGDWDGDGSRDIGLYEPHTGRFRLRTSAAEPPQDVSFGPPDSRALVGDFDGDRVTDLAIYREGVIHLDLDRDGGKADVTIPFGGARDVPIAGDWDGDGVDDLGLFRPEARTFFLDLDFQGGEAERAVDAGYAEPGDVPIAGDWDGDGRDDVGLFRPEGRTFYQDATHDGEPDRTASFAGAVAADAAPIVWNPATSALAVAKPAIIGLFSPKDQRFLWNQDEDSRLEAIDPWQPDAGWQGTLRYLAKQSAKIRAQDWLVGWEMFAAHPILGVGIGDYKAEFLPYSREFLQTPLGRQFRAEVGPVARAEQAHNDYVQIAAEMGLVGVIAVGALIVVLGRRFRDTLRRRVEAVPERFLYIGLGLGLLTLGLHAGVSFPLHLPASAMTLALLIGMINGRRYGDQAADTVVLPGRRWTRVGVIVVLVVGLVLVPLAIRNHMADVRVEQAKTWLQQGRHAELQMVLNASMHLDFQPRQALVLQGAFDYQNERYGQCVEAFNRAQRVFHQPTNYYYLGQCHLRRGEIDRAVDRLVELARLRPMPRHEDLLRSTLDYMHERASQARNVGNRASAQRLWEGVTAVVEAGQLDWTAAPEARLELARTYDRGGNRQTAMRELREVIERHPGFVGAYVTLGRWVDDADEAATSLRRGLGRAERGLRIVEARLSAGSDAISEERRSELRERRDRLQHWKDEATAALERVPAP